MSPIPSCYDFDSPEADVILLSSEPDCREFRLHKCILATASPFFRDMFSLPQSPAEDSRLPVISVSESGSILDPILRFLYPIPNPDISSLDELVRLVDVAIKYEFEIVLSSLRRVLVSPPFVEEEPMKIFSIACRYEFENEAKIASRYTLRQNVIEGPLTDDLKYISGYSYHRLLELHRTRARAAQKLLQPSNDLKCSQCNGTGFTLYGCPRWWCEFEARAREELAVRPTSDVIFGIEFLAKTLAVGCPRCPASLFESTGFLQELKQQIDSLPDTI
ncbi:hypothetical protein BD779DRAFT_151993 [Infundibulicybe gibba]|nr:hypothetical protein BD779DRAFT_151993 [Infundibulicybe gibba]